MLNRFLVRAKLVDDEMFSTSPYYHVEVRDEIIDCVLSHYEASHFITEREMDRFLDLISQGYVIGFLSGSPRYNDDLFITSVFSDDVYEVDSRTVEQFTGFYDKNLTPIFEGDELNHVNHPGFISKVRWNQWRGAWVEETACERVPLTGATLSMHVVKEEP